MKVVERSRDRKIENAKRVKSRAMQAAQDDYSEAIDDAFDEYLACIDAAENKYEDKLCELWCVVKPQVGNLLDDYKLCLQNCYDQ